MLITDVRAVQPITPETPRDWRLSMGQILVAVDTDRGLTGYGVGGGGLAGVHVVRSVLRDLLLGRDPEPIAALWQAMYDATLPFGRKGIAIMALSGVDLALWDLQGKAANCSVTELLGGAAHRRLPTYGTVWHDMDPALLGTHRAFKLHVEQNQGQDPVMVAVQAVERTRQTIGPDCPLMIDAWMRWTVPVTLQVADAVLSHQLGWIEEPLPPDDLAGYAELVGRCPIPIAGGEHEYTARGFAELIDRRLHQVLQPDVCWCGGMTQLVQIYQLAKKAGLRVCPHRGAELWALPALAALDPDPLAESGRPWMTWVGGQPPIIDGFIEVPGGPGFGVHIDEDKLQVVNW
jgi:L-rhamnonate dehydratase